jgi:hypothetical protein
MSYFKANTDYCWRWEDHGEVVALAGGPTIAYRAWLLKLLDVLAPQGLPPFGSLLMAVAATNSDPDVSVALLAESLNRALPGREAAGQVNHELTEAIALLRWLAALPGPYRQGQKRLLVLQALFAKAHNGLSAPKSRAAVRELQNPTETLFSPAAFDVWVAFRDVKTLAVASRRYPTPAALLAAVNDLPDLPPDNVPELPPAPTPDTLIAELLTNEATFHVGALIKPLWAALTLPVYHALPTQQPLGGVSDLTNKGPLDRLLLTEFAQDDLVFLSRLANNEALFLNRERPPATNPHERVYLLDVSIRTWGTPRTLAYALLVAMANHPKTDLQSRAIAVGNTARPLAFGTAAAILNSLLHLDSSLHPTNGLTQALADSHPAAERVLLTTPETLVQPALQRWLADNPTALTYLITTAPDGTITTYKQQRNTRKHVQTIQLPLEKLWDRPKPKKAEVKPPADHETNVDVPEWPILFPITKAWFFATDLENGPFFALTRRGSLLVWRGKSYEKEITQMGWKVLMENLPVKSSFFGFSERKDGNYILLIFSCSNRSGVLVDCTKKISINFRIDNWKERQYKYFIGMGEHFYWLTSTQYWTIDMETAVVAEHPKGVSMDIQGTYYEQINLKNALTKLISYKSVLQNVIEVYINEEDQLVINRHKLTKNNYKIMFSLSVLQSKEDSIPNKNRSIFTFSNQFTVHISKDGMMVLRIEDTDDISFYIPLVLDESLGIVAINVPTNNGKENFFSGNPYYQITPNQTYPIKQVSISVIFELLQQYFIEPILSYDASAGTAQP